MLSWPSSHRIRYRGDGSPRRTSSTTPGRGRRSVDSDSATTRLPTSKAIFHPSSFVLAAGARLAVDRVDPAPEPVLVSRPPIKTLTPRVHGARTNVHTP